MADSSKNIIPTARISKFIHGTVAGGDSCMITKSVMEPFRDMVDALIRTIVAKLEETATTAERRKVTLDDVDKMASKVPGYAAVKAAEKSEADDETQLLPKATFKRYLVTLSPEGLTWAGAAVTECMALTHHVITLAIGAALISLAASKAKSLTAAHVAVAANLCSLICAGIEVA